jgi:hypothetical protein
MEIEFAIHMYKPQENLKQSETTPYKPHQTAENNRPGHAQKAFLPAMLQPALATNSIAPVANPAQALCTLLKGLQPPRISTAPNFTVP